MCSSARCQPLCVVLVSACSWLNNHSGCCARLAVFMSHAFGLRGCNFVVVECACGRCCGCLLCVLLMCRDLFGQLLVWLRCLCVAVWLVAQLMVQCSCLFNYVRCLLGCCSGRSCVASRVHVVRSLASVRLYWCLRADDRLGYFERFRREKIINKAWRGLGHSFARASEKHDIARRRVLWPIASSVLRSSL